MAKSDRRSSRSGSGAARLIAEAGAARRRALAGYSRFKVGAALETAAGVIVAGCNIENASYGLTMCAERVALFKALSEGHREFRRISIVSDAEEPTAPCGACRQLLWEFCGNVEVRAVTLDGRQRRWRMRALLPHPFDARSLGGVPSRRRARRR